MRGTTVSQPPPATRHPPCACASHPPARPPAPPFPCRPEVEAVSLARDVVNHAAVHKALPFLIVDGTSLLGASSVTLADAAGQQTAILAVKWVPAGAPEQAQESMLEGARRLAEQRADEYSCAQQAAAAAGAGAQAAEGAATCPHLAVGVVSNVEGLQWLTPPAEALPLPPGLVNCTCRRKAAPASLQPRAGRRVLRWAAQCAVAAAAAVAAAMLLLGTGQ